MENSALHYSWSDNGEHENSAQAAIRRRREALALFLDNPEAAAQQYPELLDDLRSFFIHSSNPYIRLENEPDESENSRLVDKWTKAQRWAVENGIKAAGSADPAPHTEDTVVPELKGND